MRRTRPSIDPGARPRAARARGFTLPEVLVALSIAGVLLAAVMTQWIESTALALKAAETIEHSRGTRLFVSRVAEDMRNAQSITIYPTFADRATPRRDGEMGNYLILREISAAAAITRTIGYYLIATPDGKGWMLHRHDSNDGVLAADALPDPSTVGQHRRIARAVTLPDSANLFRLVRDRAVTTRGEFGVDSNLKVGRTEFVQCTLSTRS